MADRRIQRNARQTGASRDNADRRLALSLERRQRERWLDDDKYLEQIADMSDSLWDCEEGGESEEETNDPATYSDEDVTVGCGKPSVSDGRSRVKPVQSNTNVSSAKGSRGASSLDVGSRSVYGYDTGRKGNCRYLEVDADDDAFSREKFEDDFDKRDYRKAHSNFAMSGGGRHAPLAFSRLLCLGDLVQQ